MESSIFHASDDSSVGRQELSVNSGRTAMCGNGSPMREHRAANLAQLAVSHDL